VQALGPPLQQKIGLGINMWFFFQSQLICILTVQFQISKFQKKMTRKVLFGHFRVKNAISGHFGLFFVITASYHPIKVPKTIKSILMYIDVYKHVFIKHF
jgi:hypothetical protein